MASWRKLSLNLQGANDLCCRLVAYHPSEWALVQSGDALDACQPAVRRRGRDRREISHQALLDRRHREGMIGPPRLFSRSGPAKIGYLWPKKITCSIRCVQRIVLGLRNSLWAPESQGRPPRQEECADRPCDEQRLFVDVREVAARDRGSAEDKIAHG